MDDIGCDRLRTTWTDEQNLQLLRLLHDVEEGVTDQADYLFLLQLVADYISDRTTGCAELVHRWARAHRIANDVELPNEIEVERGVPLWLA